MSRLSSLSRGKILTELVDWGKGRPTFCVIRMQTVPLHAHASDHHHKREAIATRGAGERRSRRARRGRAPLTVSSDETLAGLKLRVLEALGVDPRNAALHVRGRLLENDDATLAGARR